MINETNILFGAGHLFCAGLFAILGAGSAQGTIERNRFAGIRTKKSLKSDKNWKAMNEYGGKRLLFWSAILAVFAVACFFIPFGSEENPRIALIVMAACAPGLIFVPLSIELYIFEKRLD